MGAFANADGATGKHIEYAWRRGKVKKRKACAFNYVQAFIVDY